MGLNATEFYQVTFGKRDDGTFYFSQETFPAEMLPELEEVYQNAELTPVDWTDSSVTQADVETQLEQILQLGNLID